MPEEIVEAPRIPLDVRRTSRRHIEERVALRFPGIVAPLASLVWRLPRRSRLRRAIVGRRLRLAYEASNRGDYRAMVLLYHPDGEVSFPPEIAGLGWQVGRGPAARAQVQRRWLEEWEGFWFEQDWALDLGDRLLVVGHMGGSGLSSGAAVRSEWANLFTISGGLANREEVFNNHAEAFEAAGMAQPS